MHDSDIQEILRSSDMWALHLVSEENIRYQQEIYVRSMSRYQHKWTFCFDIMRYQQFQLMVVNNNFFIDLFENLVKEPGHCSNKWHFIIWNHFFDDRLRFPVDLIHNVHRCTWFLLPLFNDLRNRLLNSGGVKHQRFILLIRSRLE